MFVPTLRSSSRGPARRLRQLLLSLAAAVCLAGCAESAKRRLNESEAQGYKLQLIRSSRGQLSQDQAMRFHRHPARTRQALDQAYQAACEATEAEAAVERARFEAERKAAAKPPAEQGESGAADPGEPAPETRPGGEAAPPTGPGAASEGGAPGKS